MNENQLKNEIFTWYNEKLPGEIGMLFNIVDKEGYKLGYVARDGSFCSFELKVTDSKYYIEHLKNQLNFAENVSNRNGLPFFVFSLDQFKYIMASLIVGPTINAITLSQKTLGFIKQKIEQSEVLGNETIKLDFNQTYYK